MSININRALVLSIVLLFATYTANAQFMNNNKQKKSTMFAIGGGLGVVDPSPMGFNLMLELRKPLAVGQNYSLSGNFAGSVTLGTTGGKESTFEARPAGSLTLNFNVFSGATKAATNAFGGFIGVGLFFTQPVDVIRKGETVKTGFMGPALQAGPRFRLGKTYMDIRAYLGLAVGDVTQTNVGFNLMFTFGVGKKRSFGMH